MIRILVGHVLPRLRELENESIHCCVTSPPYWNLRNYHTPPQIWGDGWQGSLGNERLIDNYLEHLMEVCTEIWRVLRNDGVFYLNISDSYNNAKVGNTETNKNPKVVTKGFRKTLQRGLKPKSLCLIPQRLVIRLQEAGWIIRSSIIWAKLSTVPESAKDRPTRSHENIFMLTKSAKYYWDDIAVQEPQVSSGTGGFSRKATLKTIRYKQEHAQLGGDAVNDGFRNQRDVWLLGPENCSELHFAAFPSEIARRAILAGTSQKGVCQQCGAPWKRLVSRTTECHHTTTATVGWAPTCACEAGAPIPATCLDPFLGSGTTCLVADQLRRDCIGIELNPDYAERAEARIRRDNALFCEIAA